MVAYWILYSWQWEISAIAYRYIQLTEELGNKKGRGIREKQSEKEQQSTILWSHPCGACRRLNSCFMVPVGTMIKLGSAKGGLGIAEGRVRGRLFSKSSESTNSSSLETNLEDMGGKPGRTKLSSRSTVSCWKPTRKSYPTDQKNH